ncbi:MAG: methionyl-tRNA formyltransferase [Rhodospirillales bacterium]|nr:methionyl-tRNA formyltransferase [Alphaproteobacteria bacterium]MCB9986679.1 methionyl-tRNA formyltransferase [Rhodospirillales bacterium]USO06795.1 MAG: methionyl-tRNA formyltransferase [Rhodospirillales bacterium]
MKLVFMGTPDFVVPVLDALIAGPHEILAVYTQPPRPAGRGYGERRSPVHERAAEAGLEIRTPRTLRDEAAQKEFAALGADAAIVAGYGLILPRAVLETPKYGCINVHVSLLPRWRGASPVQYAILSGDAETGVTIMKIDVGMDSGDIIAQQTIPIANDDTAPALYLKLFTMGARMLGPVLNDIENLKPVPQDETRATHAPLLDKKAGHIDWTQSATEIDRRIRALNPWPGTFTHADKKRIKILAATPTAGHGAPGTVLNPAGIVACGADALKLLRVQPDGGKPMDATAAINGNILKPGDVLA